MAEWLHLTYDHSTPAIAIGGGCNTLGVLRALGRRGIPMTLLTTQADRNGVVRYSRYAGKRLVCPDPREETQFIGFLLDMGRQADRKRVVIPSGDIEVMALCRHAEELKPYYLLPVPPFETIQKLVNKKMFYELLAEKSVPYPKTYFPEDVAELRSIGWSIDYPYIVKPVYSKVFYREFRTKCFVVHSPRELDEAARRLSGKELEVMLQEIIPGEQIYMFNTYSNRSSAVATACGYDKVRQFPVDFGCGTLCRTAWRLLPGNSAIQLLEAIGYHGFAEAEFKKDPRDGEYKLLEINARTTLQNRLPAACGVDNEYLAYLEVTGQRIPESLSPTGEAVWVDDLLDSLSCLIQLKRGTLGIRDLFHSLKGRRVHSVADWDDPLPLVAYPLRLAAAKSKRLLHKLTSAGPPSAVRSG